MTWDADKALSRLNLNFLFNNFRDLKTCYFSLQTFTVGQKVRSPTHTVNLFTCTCIVRVDCYTRYINIFKHTGIPCQRNICTLVITSTVTHDQVIFMTVWWCNLWNVLTNITNRDCHNNSIQWQYFFNTIALLHVLH